MIHQKLMTPPADGRDKDEGKDFPGDLAPAGA